jgi:diguanylate cyclase (GGDEF)-like protein/PAS domain S-box-containing protein
MGVGSSDLREGLSSVSRQSERSTAARRSRTALLACSALVLMLLAWETWDHVRAHLEHERAIASQLTSSTARSLTSQLTETRLRLRGFVNQEEGMLGELAAAPDSPAHREIMWSLLQLIFPDLEVAAVLDARSGRVAALGPGLGDESLAHLRRFVRDSGPDLRIGEIDGSPTADFFASWYREGQPAGALLVRVDCSNLCLPPGIDAPPGHRLHLRYRPGSGVDTVEEGNKRPASEEGSGTLLASAPLIGTGWVLEDRLDAQHSSRIVRHRAAQAVAKGAAVLLAVAILWYWIARASGRTAQGERNAREGRLELQAILTATTDGIVLTNPQGRIERFNPAAEMMFGRLTEDVLNADVSKLLPDFFSHEGATAFIAQRPGETAAPLVRETLGRRKGGKDFPVRLWVSGVHLGDGPRLLIVIQDLSEHQQNEEQLAFLEQRDVLTGLFNRKELERHLNSILADEDRGAGPHALCYVDVDQFKLVNDSCGHEAGDKLLKQIAILFEAKLRGAEMVARLGSDEFGALFLNQTAEQAREICDDFMQTVRNFLFTWRDRSFDIAVSIGLIELTQNTDSASSALRKADVACHMAKRHGRDRIHIYHEGDAELIRHQGDIQLISAISTALSEGRFHLYAQPIMPIAPSSEQRHFEVLVRMMDQSGQPVVPDNFIPAAERYILMPSVDRWIINRLFNLQAENLRAWHRSEPHSFLFAVNLSGTSLTDAGFLRYLKRQFTEWDVPYQSICFEITETAAVRNLDSARAFMEELAALGCSFALDDFGTGLASYRYLRELPVDYLKIDGSFVRDMTEDPVNYALVDSINQIGHVLGLRTIAEWAEDKAIVNQLRALNVDFAQGYGVGKPIALCDLTLAHAFISQPTGGKSS